MSDEKPPEGTPHAVTVSGSDPDIIRQCLRQMYSLSEGIQMNKHQAVELYATFKLGRAVMNRYVTSMRRTLRKNGVHLPPDKVKPLRVAPPKFTVDLGPLPFTLGDEDDGA